MRTALVYALRAAGYDGPIAVTARDDEARAALQGLPVQHIYLPFAEAALHAADHAYTQLRTTPTEGATP